MFACEFEKSWKYHKCEYVGRIVEYNTCKRQRRIQHKHKKRYKERGYER